MALAYDELYSITLPTEREHSVKWKPQIQNSLTPAGKFPLHFDVEVWGLKNRRHDQKYYKYFPRNISVTN